jgi:hypothetical protein
LVVGGPDVGFTVMLGVLALAAAGDANTPAASITLAAATVSTCDRLWQRENRVVRTLTEPVACWGIRTGPPPPPQEARRASRPVTGTGGLLASAKHTQVVAGTARSHECDSPHGQTQCEAVLRGTTLGELG